MLYFTTQPCNPTCSVGVWSTDGTQEGTRQIFSRPNAYPGQLVVANETVFFSTYSYPCTDTCTSTLWSTDGTPDGAVELTSVRNGSLINLNSVDGTLVFTSQSRSGAERLWTSDGTSQGTQPVRDIRFGDAGSDPSQLSTVRTIRVRFSGIEIGMALDR